MNKIIQSFLKINNEQDNTIVPEENSLVNNVTSNKKQSKNLTTGSNNQSLTKDDLNKFKDTEIKQILNQMNEIKAKLNNVLTQKEINNNSLNKNKSINKSKSSAPSLNNV